MAQQKKLSIFLFIVIALQHIDNANTKCVEVKLFIQANYLEQSVRKAFRHIKIIETSSSFKKNYEKVAASASVSASYGGFSGSASAAYEGVTEAAVSSSKSRHVEQTTETTFDPSQNQIIEKILITVSIDGRTAKTITQDIVDVVDEKNSPTHLELRKRAEDYISYNYGDIQGGTVRKNTYQATTCVKVNYVLKLANQECTSNAIIHNLYECKLAIRQLNLRFIRSEDEPDAPKGCYKYAGGTNSYWNTRSPGKVSWKYNAICKAD